MLNRHILSALSDNPFYKDIVVGNLYIPAHEGEGEGAGGSGEGAGGSGEGENKIDWSPGKKIPDELQDKLNSIVAAEKSKNREAMNKVITELDALKKRSNYTDKERSELDERIGELQSQLQTKDEITRQQAEKTKKAHEKQIDELTNSRDSWRNRYTTSRIENELLSAASKNKAFNPNQIFTLLRGSTKLVEVLDEAGVATGDFKTEVSIDSKDKDGKPITLKLTPDEAVKHISEMDEHMNLFESDGSGGFGGSSRRGRTTDDPAKMASDPETYRKNRDKILKD